MRPPAALAQAVAAGQLPADEVPEACQRIAAIPIILHHRQDAVAVIAVTQQLERKSAYDAAYIVLAQQLNAELWTLDGKLARNAKPRGLPVQLIKTP